MRLLRDREDWALLLLAAGCLGLAFLFAKFSSEVLDGELRSVDVALRDWMLRHRTAAGVTIFQGITFLGAKELLIPLGILIGWRLFRGTKGWLLLVIFCALASAEFVGLLKRVYQVGRPAGGIERSMGLSFPSGHSAGSAAILIFLGYVAVRHRVPRGMVLLVVAFVVLLVGLSRVYLDMHWMSDVLGGWMIGAAFGVGSCALYELIQRHRGGGAKAEAPARSRPSS